MSTAISGVLFVIGVVLFLTALTSGDGGEGFLSGAAVFASGMALNRSGSDRKVWK